ncbi:hypothetical protein Amet_4775 [Alkaliphilus metalliredigens QYMF]|uniref:DUF2508 domain-containing protein n=1 Tax=Alkaliphilus metalliredigens (strain QYMF) TaxID=293826 RepID=A6TXC3_ALKMQ|nr:DUF2508 family protein [Alkaliphilus metalliredigens]ABR50841.1 hypothetical protein Amet_4775 [Alkaliphilus metalliredigens QYMF]
MKEQSSIETNETNGTKKEKAVKNVVSVLENLYNKIGNYQEPEIDEEQAFIQQVLNAHEEWKNAEGFFHNVSDPDLVDHAIYKLEAAKTRYIYLLKKAKEEGVRVNFH